MKIAVLGSINMDLVVRVPRLPLAGETLRGHDFFRVPGGKGANQAVAAARLGADVTLIGRVGNDDLGREALDALEHERVDTSRIAIDPDEPTGVALICVADDGENTIVTSGGANHRIADVEIPDADMLLVQLEVPMAAVSSAVRAARCPVVLDPAPVAALPPDVLDGLEWITPNEVEAQALTGRTEPAQAARELLRRGVKNVVVTLGPDGCLASSEGSELHVPAPDIQAVDTVACGDAFNAALAVALSSGAPVAEALRRGCAAGALAATKPGAQRSLPSARELEGLLR